MYSNAFILNILLYIFIIHKVSSICTEYGQHVSCDTIYDVAKHYDSSWRKLFIRNTDSFQYLTELEICPSIDDLSELIINEYLFKIHPNAFSQLKKLWSLKLVNNRILTMEENTFNGRYVDINSLNLYFISFDCRFEDFRTPLVRKQ